MNLAEISELAGVTIKTASVYSDAVMIELADGKTAVAAFLTAKGLRVKVRARGPEGMPPSGRVYPGLFPYPGELPDYVHKF